MKPGLFRSWGDVLLCMAVVVLVGWAVALIVISTCR